MCGSPENFSQLETEDVEIQVNAPLSKPGLESLVTKRVKDAPPVNCCCCCHSKHCCCCCAKGHKKKKKN